MCSGTRTCQKEQLQGAWSACWWLLQALGGAGDRMCQFVWVMSPVAGVTTKAKVIADGCGRLGPVASESCQVDCLLGEGHQDKAGGLPQAEGWARPHAANSLAGQRDWSLLRYAGDS